MKQVERKNQKMVTWVGGKQEIGKLPKFLKLKIINKENVLKLTCRGIN